MARIGCLWVPDLPLAALLRIEPELRDRPLVLTDGRASCSRVVALAPVVRGEGIVPGMTAVQVRGVSRSAVLRPISPETIHAAAGALADVARTLSVQVEQAVDGAVFFDCEGSGALCASEAELATVLGARAERQGLPAWVGIAGSKLAARLAARIGGGVRIIASGETRAVLAALPIGLLDPDERIAAVLTSWGIRRIGDLAALPAGALAHRLGSEGARLARVARGEDDEPLHGQPTPLSFAEAVQLEYGVERVETLLFVVRRLLDRMIERLAIHGLACAALEIGLDLDGGGRHRRRLSVAAPTREARILLLVIRTHLEREPPRAAVNGLRIVGTAARIRPAQLDFFRPSGPAPAIMAATIARLAALCGPDRVGTPCRSESHRPEVVTLVPFGGISRVGKSRASAGTSEGPGPDAATPAVIVARVALRAFRPPVPLEVFESRGCLDYVRGRSFGGRVVHAAGPWRLQGEWWTPDPFAREYYDVELSDGGVYRIYHDLRTRSWLADGAYD